MLNVHVRINDSRTGKPTAARLRITDGDGIYRPPLGRLARFRTGPGEDVGGQVSLHGEAWAYVDGACEVPLPPGMITIEIAKGSEFIPIRRQLALVPGQMALRFSLERWTDESAVGWHAGDMRAFDLPPHAALLEGAAEGLAVVQLLARERPPIEDTPGAVANLLAFSGDKIALRSPECLVAVNTLNTHPVLGSVSLLNCHRPVFPLRFGAPDEPDHWSVADWCDQCHRKKGLVVWPDLARMTAEHPQGEALAAIILGKIDAFEIGPDADFEGESFQLYYRLLGCGLRPVLVAASGKDSNSIPLGAVRTYAGVPPGQDLDASTWIEAVRTGEPSSPAGHFCRVRSKTKGRAAACWWSQGSRCRFALKSVHRSRWNDWNCSWASEWWPNSRLREIADRSSSRPNSLSKTAPGSPRAPEVMALNRKGRTGSRTPTPSLCRSRTSRRSSRQR